MNEQTILKVHQKVNDKLYKEYPLYDEANLKKHPEGHYTLTDIKRILESYEECKK